jgi:NADPH:quinone reductase
VRAAIIRAHGEPPVVGTRDDPEPPDGHALIAVSAAPITPLDLLCATGTSYFGAPALSYVPGVQGVGVVQRAPSVPAGTPVWFPTSAGMAHGDGSMGEFCVAPESELVPLSDEVDQHLIAALGLSAVAGWMALTWRGELRADEQVIVLGAGGIVGQVAVQAARLCGARRVVAACRSPEARERARRRGADAVVPLTDADEVDPLADRMREACDGPADLVLDPLFGVPAAAALRTLRPHGRLVNLGSSAGETAPIDSSTLRSRSLRVLGYTNNELTASQRAESLTMIVRHAIASDILVDFDPLPLSDAAAGWSRQATGEARGRIVLVP